MEDEFRAWLSYQRLARGEPDEIEYDTGESEEELLDALDTLGDGPPAGAGVPSGDWADVSPDELLKELDKL